MNASDDKTVDATLRSYALQMTGVVFRKVGNITKAVEYGERALQEAKDSTSPSATSGAARDLAASLHIRGMISAKERAKTLRDALALYDLSLEYDQIGRRPPFGENLEAGDDHYVTQGMRALLLYDMAHYRIWINDDSSEPARLNRHEALREKRDAVKLLIEADLRLMESDNQVWELNNLLKLIQVMPSSRRASLVFRAEELIVLYPSRNKELWVAMMGRPFMRLAVKVRTERERH